MMDKQQLIEIKHFLTTVPPDCERWGKSHSNIPLTPEQANYLLGLLEQGQKIKQQCMNAFAAGIMRSDEDVTGKTLPELFDEFWKLNTPK